MKIVKIIAIAAVLFTTSLITTCSIVEHPLDSQYDQTLQIVTEKGQFPSKFAALQVTPELIAIKDQIKNIKFLKAELHDLNRGKPMPLDTNAQQELIKKINTAKETEKIVMEKLVTISEGK